MLCHQSVTEEEIRLLKETGRLSKEPIFVVGIYSAELKIGEGFGKSLRIAENRVLSGLHLTLIQDTESSKSGGTRRSAEIFHAGQTDRPQRYTKSAGR